MDGLGALSIITAGGDDDNKQDDSPPPSKAAEQLFMDELLKRGLDPAKGRPGRETCVCVYMYM